MTNETKVNRIRKAAKVSLHTALAFDDLADAAEKLAFDENGSGPLTDEAARLRRNAAEYRADHDDLIEQAEAL